MAATIESMSLDHLFNARDRNFRALVEAGIPEALGFSREETDRFLDSLPGGPIPGEAVLAVPGRTKREVREIGKRLGVFIAESALEAIVRTLPREAQWLPELRVESHALSRADRLRTANLGSLVALYLPLAIKLGVVQLPDGVKKIDILSVREGGKVLSLQLRSCVEGIEFDLFMRKPSRDAHFVCT